MFEFDACSLKTFCVRQYLVKADKNEKSLSNEEIKMNVIFLCDITYQHCANSCEG